ncbi:MAG TPA: glycosyltransferase family 39 protein, partial [Chitinophagaceae bacterium]|nr:glycosyltransferase family 39 protein [Chitinophagaceae bacterium]
MTSIAANHLMTNTKGRSRDFISITIIIILLIRLVLVGCMGPMPQDAYYFMYSEHPALSYFDHPPMIAYILKVFVSIFGKNVFAIKLANTVVTFLTLYFFYRLARNMMGPARARKAILLLFSTVMISIISLVSTPDTPLLLFWTLSLLFLHKALFKEKNFAWLWAGFWMGIAFDSKYSAIFLPVGLIFFLLFSDRYRKKLISPWFGLAIIIFLVVISPVFIWNLQHDFASFRFQSSERAGGIGGHVY